MQKMKLNLQFFASGTINASSTTMPSGTGKIEWSSSVISGTNKSSVTAIVYARRTSGSGTYCTVSGSVTINGSSKSISKYRGSDDKWTTSWKEVGRYTTEVTHNEDGTKSINISFSISADTGGMDGTAKGSGSATLDKINRASKLNAIDDFKLTDTITINITKYITTATDKLQIKLGDTLIREVANISNGYELTFTTTEQTTIKNLMTSPQATLIFLLTTINGGTTLGTSTQSATVTSLDKPVYRNVIKKENGHYQVAINGVVDTTINDTLQVYDDEGNLSLIYYKPGDTYKINNYVTVCGSITASKGQIRFGIFTPKLLTNVSNTITVNKAYLTIRNSSGSYILDNNNVASSLGAFKGGDNAIYLRYSKSSISGTNNTPVSVEINDLELTFN